MAGDHVLHRRAAALVGHVLQIHARDERNSSPPRCWKLPTTGGGVIELAGLLLRQREQFLHVVHRKRGLTTSTFGPVARMEIGAKDLIGS